MIKQLGILVILAVQLTNCSKLKTPMDVLPLPDLPTVNEDTVNYPDVPQSDIYEVTVIQGETRKKLVVFQSTCPQYQAGYMDMTTTDQYPLALFAGRSISWANFSMSGTVTIEVKVLNKTKVPTGGTVKILPTRYNITPTVEGDVIRFTMTDPGQCSVEVGDDGYKNGLMIFANPAETDIPDSTSPAIKVLHHVDQDGINALPATYSGLYFTPGVHDIGVYHVPANIKNIYLADGAWVYGSLIMDGDPNVKIYGRGILSSGRMKYRETHCIEAINGSDNITIEGIVVADPKYFSVRLIGNNNNVNWVKVIGSWTYNCDGISAFAGSTVSHCFIWANDDNIKVYRDNIIFSDIVCWQLNNGGIIQLGWGNANAANVTISRVDVLHAEWNNEEVNRGVLSCVGDKFAAGGMSGSHTNFLIDDLVTETPVPLIFRVSPNPTSPDYIHGMYLKNWNVKMDLSKGFSNYIIGTDPNNKYDGFVFDHFIFNGVQLTASNWITQGRFQIGNLVTPVFK